MKSISRRAFLGSAAAAVVAPTIVPSSVFGQNAPSERVTMGLIGCGGMGMSNLNHLINFQDVQFVAVCDVNESQKGHGRNLAKERVEKHYAEKVKDGSYKGCTAYKDFRELCGRKDIQAVVVATPDHWHALASVEALKNGKDVYCEKPVTHLFAEGPIVIEAKQKHKRIFQTGSQQRSERDFRRAVEIVRNGLIGKVHQMEVQLPIGHTGPQGNPNKTTIPEGLDYDMWCGPSKVLPYNEARHNFHWRWNMAYGAGQMMDWIGHHNDIGHWGINEDLGGPVEVEAFGFEYPPENILPLYDAPNKYGVRCKYASGVESTITSNKDLGTKWTGDKGWVFVTRGKIDASNKEWLNKDFKLGDFVPYTSNDHRRNFIDGVKTRKDCIATIETAFRSIVPGLLGYASQAVGKKIKWDPKEMKVVGDDAAEKVLKAMNYREPWKLEA